MKYDNYYKMPISMFWFWFWLIIMGFFTIASMGALFFFLIVPVIVFFQLKKTDYSYNDRELKIRKGLIFKTRSNIAINEIEEINVKLGLLNLIAKARPISLVHIKNLNEEADKFIQVWNNNR